MLAGAPAGAAQKSVDCSFADPDFEQGLIVITPNTARPGDTVEVSWVPGTQADRNAMDRFDDDPTWTVRLAEAVLYVGEPPHKIGGYRWENLVLPADAPDGAQLLFLSRQGADVWSCPITIEGGAPPTTTTTEAEESAEPEQGADEPEQGNGEGAAAEEEGDDGTAGFTAPLLLGAGIALAASMRLGWWLRRHRSGPGTGAGATP